MSKKKIIAAVLVAGAAGAIIWGLQTWQQARAPADTVAWGNVDVREVQLAFETSGRIASLKSEEGDIVKAGDRIGSLDTELLEIQLMRAQANARKLEAVWRLARDGSRVEDIAAGKANLAVVERELALARTQEARQQALMKTRATSQDMLDTATANRKALQAQRDSLQATLDKLVAGSRADEIAEAAASRDAALADVAEIQYRIDKASQLVSPVNGQIRSRLCEPGDMVTSSKNVYEISVISPKWVRVYVTEPQLAHVKPGVPVRVSTDTTEALAATVASVSPEAEFTPKTVQTQELRSNLVYEVRLLVEDEANRLKLGQPVTVDFASRGQGAP